MMKKLIYTLLFLVSAISSYSQDVFPTSDAIWNIKFTQTSSFSAQWFGLVGDTIINDTVYSRLCSLKDSVLTRDAEISYLGGIRLADRKVWLRAKVYDSGLLNEREILLYDFTPREVGDCFSYGGEILHSGSGEPELIFSSNGSQKRCIIDVFEDELGRKHYTVMGGHIYVDEWIEGLGGLRGLFFQFAPFNMGISNPATELQCFKHKGRVEYHNPSWCSKCFCPDQLAPVSIAEERAGSISLYPNPTQESIRIKLLAADLPCIFTLYDLGGVLLSSDPLNESTTEVSLSGYPDGTYIYRISGLGRVVQSGKVIVNRSIK